MELTPQANKKPGNGWYSPVTIGGKEVLTNNDCGKRIINNIYNTKIIWHLVGTNGGNT